MGRGEVTERDDPERFLAVLRRTVEALDRWRRPYAIFGTVATNVYLDGEPAEDIDVFVAEGDAPGALDALVTSGFEAGERDESWIFKASRGGVLIDVIFRVRGRLAFDDGMAAGVGRTSYRGVDVPVPAPEDLVLIAAAAAHPQSPEHWYVAARLVAEPKLDWERLVQRARANEPLRIAGLLLYCESDGVDVPAGTVTSLLPS
jgi:Uncharacterised nucleotidyltransferase